MNEDKIRGLLPIGSVVRVRDMNYPLMIYGVLHKDIATGKAADYISVLWPEGNLGAGSQLMFNHEDIEKVLFKGLNLIERDAFIEALVSANRNGEFEV